MRKGIYTYYKERLIEIGGSNKCLYLKSVKGRSVYDVGRILEGRDGKVAELVEFLWSKGKYPFSLINEGEADELLVNIEGGRGIKTERAEARQKIEKEVTRLKELRREVEEIERESGRYELYLGYPFVFGCIPQGPSKTLIKAPLLLFPVKIDIIGDSEAEIRLNTAEKVHINPALVYAYAQSKRINVDALELELDNIYDRFDSVKDVVDYLATDHVKIELTTSKNIFNYERFKEPETKSELSVRYAAVLGRFPLSNSIYNDYTMLERDKLTNDALSELLLTGKRKKVRPRRTPRRAEMPEPSYAVKMLDFAQSEVVKRVAKNGNMVIYGPPGTGKSQTIVNVITDALSKHKSVLVVSQKKAALDVVYNRLGTLSEQAMYITDEGKQKRAFYEKCLAAHQASTAPSGTDTAALIAEYAALEEKIAAEDGELQRMFDTLNSKRPFGLSLAEMYASSSNIAKNSTEYGIYKRLIEDPELLALDYGALSEALFAIRSMSLGETYFRFMENKEKNPLIDNLLPEVDIRTLGEVKAELTEIQKSKKGLFNTAAHPYYREVLAYYRELHDEKKLDAIVSLEMRLRGRSPLFSGKAKKKIKADFLNTLGAAEAFVKEYDCLKRVLTPDGYLAVIDNVLRGNTSYIKLVYEALDNYIALRDVSRLLLSLDRNKLLVLNFAYTASRSYQSYLDIIDKLLEVRIYHEVVRYELECESELSRLLKYNDVTEKIYRLKEQQLELAHKICASSGARGYSELYGEHKDAKNYLFQISKKQKLWPVRRTMEEYGELVLSLFPCWLLSPENVSNLLPLTKNLFDIVIFDEASQVFIENTIPSIYRGKSIVVAGDDKQLRPSATFMKRYLGADPEDIEDNSVAAALEVDSLLDLAVARYESASLTYHYRSRHEELIAFSNAAFYSSGLQIAPNISKNRRTRPIERYKVDGQWINRRNTAEAKQVVELVAEILKKRKNNESIGIITFNSDQQAHINDMLDLYSRDNADFRSAMLKERHRVENGEDTSIFVKNLENVQGDERDIIIFSVGYAKNEEGKVYTSFGSLSQEGGENRLNVAITRARSKIIVVTSIEPEELRVEGSKHEGPRLLRKYLTYVRAVAASRYDEANTILSELSPPERALDRIQTTRADVEEQIKERLEKLGYTVDTRLGGVSSRISLAVYDKDTDRYLVGVELDRDAFLGSSSTLERDVYKPRFLAARGWEVLRVWCRDWWLSPNKVIKSITTAAERKRAELTENKKRTKQ
ncbi:MAG: DUF4011 domain-containing protein [Clostridia bacterium]|nr:DUF4011 domain-containing protein [Clostridia bacterium]